MTRTTLPFSVPLLLALAGCSASPPGQGRPRNTAGPMHSTPFVWAGIKEPPARPAAEAGLADGEEVIGVVVKGKARAYLLSAFKGLTHSVVNDVVNKSALTVTYSAGADCARTFTADRDLPLPISLGGMYEGRMLLLTDGTFFEQQTGRPLAGDKKFPYAALPHKRVKWGEWKKDHPDTDVYLGPDTEDDRATEKP